MACDTGLMRAAGMALFGNGWPVSGSLMVMLFSCEKSPARMAAVGTLCRWKLLLGILSMLADA